MWNAKEIFQWHNQLNAKRENVRDNSFKLLKQLKEHEEKKRKYK